MRKNQYLFGVLALLVSVVAIGMVYAGFSQTLNINGTGNIVASKWDIYFANLSNAITAKTANVVTPAVISPKTKIGDYYVTLATPGDSVTYRFDVVNDGDFDAVLTTLTKNTPTCSPSATICNYISYTLTYTTGGAAVAQNDKLLKGQTKNMTLKIMLASNTPASALSNSEISVRNLGITLLYSQDSGYGGNPPQMEYYYLIGYEFYGNVGDTIYDLYGLSSSPGNSERYAKIGVTDSVLTELSGVGFRLNNNSYYMDQGLSNYSNNISTLNQAFGSSSCEAAQDEDSNNIYRCKDIEYDISDNFDFAVAGENGDVITGYYSVGAGPDGEEIECCSIIDDYVECFEGYGPEATTFLYKYFN